MHKLISTTFKILIMSMLFMFLLDTTLLMVQIVSIHSRVSNMASIMQTEVARNNCMPSAMGDTFLKYLKDIANNSTICSERDIVTNFKKGVTLNDEYYGPIDAENAGDYGDTVTLAVGITMHPAFVYYNPNRLNNKSFLLRSSPLDYTLNYIYNVPCLRYLK